MNKAFYTYPRLLLLIISLIVLLGGFALLSIPRLEQPPLSHWYGIITTQFPSSSAEQVETQVTEPIEEAMYTLEAVQLVTASSRPGLSTVLVELQPETSDINSVWSRARSKLDDVIPLLPATTGTPQFEEVQMNASALVVALEWSLPSPAQPLVLNRLAQDLSDRLRVIPGTENVELFGDWQEEISVTVEASQLASLGLTPQSLARQIQLSDVEATAGQVTGQSNQLLLDVADDLASLDAVAAVPVRASSSQQQLRLGDVAQVTRGFQDSTEETLINGKAAIALAITMDPRLQIDQWTQSAQQVLEQFQKELPPGVTLVNILDQSDYVNRRFNSLGWNLGLGSLLVLLCAVVVFGIVPALVVSVALPLSGFLVVSGLYLLGIPLHRMSVTGLIIALGLLIDNPIIVTDDILQRLKQGQPSLVAIAHSVKFLTLPLVASVLTTVLGFFPIVILPGDTGEFVVGLGVSVILALLVSLAVSLTLIPALTVRCLQRRPTQKHGKPIAWWQQGLTLPALSRWYERQLNYMFQRPVLSLGLAVIVPLAGLGFGGSLPEQFFPGTDRDQLLVEVELWPQAPIAQTRATTLQVQQSLEDWPEITDSYWFLGRNTPLFYNNIERSFRHLTHYAHGLVQLRSAEGTRSLSHQLQTELDRQFPEARIRVQQIAEGPYMSAPVELHLFGPDLELLTRLGEKARGALAQVSGITHTRATLGETIPQLQMQVDQEQIYSLGISNNYLASDLRSKLSGIIGGSLQDSRVELPVRVRLAARAREQVEDALMLDVVAPIGEEEMSEEGMSEARMSIVPLTEIGEVSLALGRGNLSRRQGQPVNTVQGFLRAGVLPAEVLKDFRKVLEVQGFELPPGYRLAFGGEHFERNAVVSLLLKPLPLVLVLMVATLLLTLRSLQSVILISVVALCSLGLGLGSLAIFGYPLGFMAILGNVSLVGVAINDAIVVLAALQANPKARQGNPIAIQAEVVRSTRHVLATTFTTAVGFLPLLIQGGEFWPPLAVCVVGGVGGATLLALTLVPCLYLLMQRRAGKR